MPRDGVLMIAMTEAKLRAESETTLEGRIRAAMNATKDHWMAVDEDTQFRAAVGAVLQLSEGKDKERIEKEIQVLKTIGAAQQGIPVDFSALGPADDYEPIGLLALWKEIKHGQIPIKDQQKNLPPLKPETDAS